MAVHLDTSVLIDAVVGAGTTLDRLEAHIRQGERFTCCTLVLYEWLRGPRRPEHIEAQRQLLGSGAPTPFGPEEVLVAADLYRRLPRARGRAIDLAIAACAITQGASLWTLNPGDFRDVPGLDLIS